MPETSFRLQLFPAPALPAASRLSRMRRAFATHGYLHLRGAFDHRHLEFLAWEVRAVTFTPVVYEGGVGRDEVAVSSPEPTLRLLFQDPALLAVVRAITGRRRLRHFAGRIYRLRRGGGELTWHDDTTRHREVAVTVNLSLGRYSGGTLEIRERGRPGAPVHPVPNRCFGDLVLFRVARRWEHRVTRVTSRTPKIAYAGWFATRPWR